jgi:hypothetical protein
MIIRLHKPSKDDVIPESENRAEITEIKPIEIECKCGDIFEVCPDIRKLKIITQYNPTEMSEEYYAVGHLDGVCPCCRRTVQKNIKESITKEDIYNKLSKLLKEGRFEEEE